MNQKNRKRENQIEGILSLEFLSERKAGIMQAHGKAYPTDSYLILMNTVFIDLFTQKCL